MRLFHIPILTAALAGPAAAQPAPTQTGPVQLTYAAYFGGINVADMQANLALSPQTYRVQLSFQVVGAASALFRSHGISTADGRFLGDRAVPRQLVSTGQTNGKPRETQIQWTGDQPTVVKMQPPIEPEREPVPAAEQAHTIDSLSAIAVLLHRVWNTGRCESGARTFDGRWTSEIAVRTVGEEPLEQTTRSSYNGTALRCDIEGHQLAGFWRDKDEAAMHKPHHASVWFARVAPGQPMVPVRIAVETRGFGEATMYLTGESAS